MRLSREQLQAIIEQTGTGGQFENNQYLNYYAQKALQSPSGDGTFELADNYQTRAVQEAIDSGALPSSPPPPAGIPPMVQHGSTVPVPSMPTAEDLTQSQQAAQGRANARDKTLADEVANMDPTGATGNDALLRRMLMEFENARQKSEDFNEARYTDILRGFEGRNKALFDNMLPQISQQFGQREDQYVSDQQRAEGRYDAARAQQRSDLGQVVDQYGQIRSEALEQLQGLGDVARGDVNRRYEAEQANQAAQLRSRGLGNTTVTSQVASGLQEQQSLDRARLEEQLRREALGYSTELGVQQAGARERAATNNSQMDIAAAQAAERGAANRAAMAGETLAFNERAAGEYSNLSLDPLTFMERRTDTAPSLMDMVNLVMQMGMGHSDRGALKSQPSGGGQGMQAGVLRESRLGANLPGYRPYDVPTQFSFTPSPWGRQQGLEREVWSHGAGRTTGWQQGSTGQQKWT